MPSHKDQLASVAAGSVLGDICNRESANRFSTDFRKKIEAIGDGPFNCRDIPDEGKPPLGDSLVILEQSRRFTAKSGIHRFRRAVNLGDPDSALAVHSEKAGRSIIWQQD